MLLVPRAAANWQGLAPLLKGIPTTANWILSVRGKGLRELGGVTKCGSVVLEALRAACDGTHDDDSSSNVLASFRSGVSNPSVNHP